MRALLLVLVLAFPFLAHAECPQGNNTPLTSNTRSTNVQQPQGGTAPDGHDSFGSQKAQRTAYPH